MSDPVVVLPPGRVAGINKILVTGGTGRLGSRLVPVLVARGYDVRVVSPDAPPASRSVEWHRQDFIDSIEFDSAVSGCDVVMHLAAELTAMEKMERVNAAATRALVTAAARQQVRSFLYTSTACVYGTPKRWTVTEDCPLISTRSGDHVKCYTTDYLKEYARTKLLGEVAIRDLGRGHCSTIVRPCNIATEQDIVSIGTWDFLTRLWRGYRHTHQVFIDDVISALIFLVERSFLRATELDPTVEVFNIANDDDPENTFRALLAKLNRATATSLYAPPVLDRIKDIVKFRSLDAWYAVGGIHYSCEHLYETGFRYPIGIAEAHRRVARASLVS